MKWNEYPNIKPPEDGEYLVYVDGKMKIDEFCSGYQNEWDENDDIEVEYWMDLPAAPL